MGTPYRDSDDALRAAHAALAERDRLRKTRDGISRELVEANALVATMSEALGDEQKDVRRYEKGVWAFLYDIFADREGRLTKEQQEAAAAQLKLDDAEAMRDRLTDQLAIVDKRLGELASADADLATARAAKQTEIVTRGGPAAKELEAILQDLGQLDAEGRGLDEALSAGSRAHASMARLVEILGSAQNWGALDMLSDSMFVSWVKRDKIDDARNIAGVAQADLAVFARELGDVGMTLHAEVAELAVHHRFLDTWFDNIFSDWSVQSRIQQALAGADGTLKDVGSRLDDLRGRRAANLARGEALSRRRLEILE